MIHNLKRNEARKLEAIKNPLPHLQILSIMGIPRLKEWF